MELQTVVYEYLLTNKDALSDSQKIKIGQIAGELTNLLGWVSNTAGITQIVLERKFNELGPEVASIIVGSLVGSATAAAGTNPLVAFAVVALTSEATKALAASAQNYLIATFGYIVIDYDSIPPEQRPCFFAGVPMIFCVQVP